MTTRLSSEDALDIVEELSDKVSIVLGTVRSKNLRDFFNTTYTCPFKREEIWGDTKKFIAKNIAKTLLLKKEQELSICCDFIVTNKSQKKLKTLINKQFNLESTLVPIRDGYSLRLYP